jgi:hypothetical protein
MAFENDDTVKTSALKVAALTRQEFNRGLIRALEGSLKEAAPKGGAQLPRPAPPMGPVKDIAHRFRALVEADQFSTLSEVLAALATMDSNGRGSFGERSAAHGFLWRLRQHVCSCPIYWRGRRAIGEIG